MRLTFKSLGLALIAATALVSCSREAIPEIEIPGEEETVEASKTHTILIRTSDEETRTMIGDEGASLWKSGDKISVFQAYFDGSAIVSEIKESNEGQTDDNGKTMTFSVDFDPVQDPSGYGFIYRAAYPAGNVYFLNSGSDPVLYAVLPSHQCPAVNSFDPQADILISRPFLASVQPAVLDLQFKRLTALGQMTVTGLPVPSSPSPESVEIKTVVFHAENHVVTEEVWFPPYENNGDVYMWRDEMTQSSNEIVMDYKGKQLQVNNFTAYFMCMPFSFAENEVFTVSVFTVEDGNNYVYQRTVTIPEGRSLAFLEGGVSHFTVNMGSAQRSPVPTFNVSFSASTLDQFPGLSNNQLVLPAGAFTPKKGATRGANGLEFRSSERCSVSVDGSWLSDYLYVEYDEVNEEYIHYLSLYYSDNDSGQTRDATLTINGETSYDSITIDVTQPPIIVPTAVTINLGTVNPYEFQKVTLTCTPADATLPWNYDLSIDYSSGDDQYVRLYRNESDGSYDILGLQPGRSVTISGEFIYPGDNDYIVVESSCEVTVSDASDPSHMYFPVNTESGISLIHRTASSTNSISVSSTSSAEATDLAFSADKSKIYITGSTPDGSNRKPRVWTVDGSSVSSESWNINGVAKKIAVEGEHVYVLVERSDGSSVVYKDQNTEYMIISSDYCISDIAVKNGVVYLCGTSQFTGYTAGNTPYVWIDGTEQFGLRTYNSSTTNCKYNLSSIAVRDNGDYADIFVSGYMNYNDTKNNNVRAYALVWENDSFFSRRMTSTKSEWLCVYDMVLLGENHHLHVGDSFINATSPTKKPAFYLDRPYVSGNDLSLNYDSSSSVSLQQIQMNGNIPVLRGTINDAPAFWGAPWKQPYTWDGEGTVVGFLVK